MMTGENVLDRRETDAAIPTSRMQARLGATSPLCPAGADASTLGPDHLAVRPSAPSVREHESRRWHVVQHRAFFGNEALTEVRRMGFEAHWPRRIVRLPRQDDRISPLFPGYLFVRFRIASHAWGALCRAETVIGLIGQREYGRPTPVRRGEVERLVVDAGGLDGILSAGYEPAVSASASAECGASTARPRKWRQADSLQHLRAMLDAT